MRVLCCCMLVLRWYSAAAVCVVFMLLYASYMLMYAHILLLYCCMLVLCSSLLGSCCCMLACMLIRFMHVRCFVMHTDALSTPFGECDTHKGTAEFVFSQQTTPSLRMRRVPGSWCSCPCERLALLAPLSGQSEYSMARSLAIAIQDQVSYLWIYKLLLLLCNYFV